MKKPYRNPKLTNLGTLVELTAALGGGGAEDQSEYPQQFPPDTGSYDICRNNDSGQIC